VRDLTPEHVEKLLAAHGHLSKSSLNRIRTNLGAALREAERRGWVLRNVARLAVTPPSWSTERRTLTPDQARALLHAARGDPLEAALWIGITRGLRPGEILGLRWSDLELDTDPPLLHVRRTLTHHKGRLGFGPPKTPGSIRTLIVPHSTLEVLHRHHTAQSEQRLRAEPVWRDLDLVTCNEIGGPLDPANFRRSFTRLGTLAGIGHWAPYELRHSAVSLLCASGVPIDQVADLAGHTDLRMVSRVYRHSLGAPVDAGAGTIDRVLDGSDGTTT